MQFFCIYLFMRCLIFTFWFALCSCLIFCQENEQKIVSKVEIRGLLTISKEALKTKLETQPGKKFSNQALRKDIQRLHNYNFFSDIKVDVIPVSTGVNVTFFVSENHRLGNISVIGNEHLDTSKILKNLRISKEKYIAPYVLSLDIIHLKELYNKEGFLFVDIKTKQKLESGFVDITIIVDEGTRAEIGRIQFFGNHSYSKETLLGIIQTQETSLFSSEYYNEDTFSQDLIHISNYYRSEGFLDVRVHLRDIFFSNDREEMVLNISVDEGVQYKVNKISIEGNKLFSKEEFRRRFTLHPGSPFKQSDMLKDKSRIQQLYGENGFLNRRVKPIVTFPKLEKFIVDIKYIIQEGSVTYIRKIDIGGNVLTKDKVLRRELLITPGERFNIGKIKRSQQRLARLRYFEPAIKLDLKDTELDDWKDLSIEVQEGRTGSMRFAAGITSDLGAVGEISLTKRNFDILSPPTSFAEFFSGESFTGAGQNLDLHFQAGKEVLLFKISFVDPYFLDYNVIFGVDAYRNERVRESWDERRTGGQFSLGRRFWRDAKFNLSYRLENVKIGDIDDDAAPDVYDVKGDNVLSSLTADFTIDTRDDFILPTRGYIIGLSYEVAGVFLGGDFDYSKFNVRLAWFQTIYTNEDNYKHVLSIGGRMGFADDHSPSKGLPIFERYFAGGATSIRGFEFRTVGPKYNDDPLGGEFMLLGTIEYNFPLYKDVLRMVLFTDVGNVISNVDDRIFDSMRVSVGFGFRLKVPMLGPRPFAFDFGFPVCEEDDDDKQIFSFSFGKPF